LWLVKGRVCELGGLTKKVGVLTKKGGYQLGVLTKLVALML
jgi:hypothetical protein